MIESLNLSAEWAQKLSIAAASVFGSIVSMQFIDKMTPKQKLFSICSGVVMSYYITPLVLYFYKIDEYASPIGFMIGLFGMSVCSALFAKIKAGHFFGLLGHTETDSESE